jgi:uncharacterized membrane protein
MDLRTLAGDLETNEALDIVAAPAAEVVDQLLRPGPTRNALLGTWLGHPLHPMLTDLPIGFWTSAFAFDLLPFRGTEKAARTMVGLGTLSALPTLASGWAEFSTLPEPKRRPAVVHAAANGVATALYAASYIARRRGHTFKGVALAMLGAGAATVGGVLGGQLTYRLGLGVSLPTANLSSRSLEGRLPTAEQAATGTPVSRGAVT